MSHTELAICEIFNPSIHGINDNSSYGINGHFLVHNTISLDALLDKNNNFLDEREKQNAKEYSKNYYPKIPIDILDLREQKIIKMYYFLGYKEKEIANYFNLSHQRVNKIKSRALKKLKNALLEN